MVDLTEEACSTVVIRKGCTCDPTQYCMCPPSQITVECVQPEKASAEFPPAFQSLLDLQPNWDSYGAKRINPACAQKAYEIWRQLAGTWLPVPHSDGTVGLEQHQGGFDIEINVDMALTEKETKK